MDYPVIFPNKGDLVIDIPFPYDQFTDTIFFISQITQGSSYFIPDDYYTRIDDHRICFPKDNVLGIDENSEIRFTFIHKENKRWIGKTEYHLTIKEFGQRELSLPNSPYNVLLNINKRIYVFYNRKRQTQGIDYLLQSSSGKITFINKKMKSLINDRVDIMIIYTGSNNGAIQELPQSGYIYLSKKDIDRNYNTNLMGVFIDGKLIDNEDILQMTNTIYKIDKDIGSRYNIEVKNFSPKINSIVPYFKQKYYQKNNQYEKITKDIFSRIEVPYTETYNRQFIKPQFNPVFFSPYLIQKEDYWINLILRKSQVNYQLNFYSSDYLDQPNQINVVLQLRRTGQREFIYNSKSSILAAVLPPTVTNINKDYVIFSIQVQNILRMDNQNNIKNIDGIIGRFQSNIREYNETDPIYYTLNADSFDHLTYVNIFQWTITTEPENQGRLIWSQDIDFIPDNLLSLVKEVDSNE